MGRLQPVIGLDVGSSAIKMVHLSEKGGEYTLEHYGVRELDPDAIVDGAVMDAGHVADTIRALFDASKLRGRQVAISVAGNSVIVKKIHVPIMSADELAESISWEAEQYIPFEINDVHLDFHIVEAADESTPSGKMPVLLVAAKKERVSELVTLVQEAGLKPMVVDVDAFGLENIFCTNYGVGDRVTGLVNIGASVININILLQGMTAFTRDISMGGDRYTEDIQKALNISFAEAERAKRGEAIEGIDPEHVLAMMQRTGGEMAAEIGRTFDYFRTTSQVGQVDKVLLSGGASRAAGLQEQIAERLGLPVQMLNPFEHIHMGKGIDTARLHDVAHQLGVAAGLATRRVNDR
ncbi:MAG: type IV pilus assembly protein PilM [Nitrospirae bacterium]|nr:type IV pilus assembly protein PilM [Nitrospirota bacterium]